MVTHSSASEKTSAEPIAIVGVAFRLPGANDGASLWKNLMSGTDSVGTVPTDRWTMEKGCPELKDEHKSVRAGFIDVDVDKFDASFFGLSPLELSFIDPQARLLLQLSWEALENAGIPPKSLRGTAASVLVGIWRDEYKDLVLTSGSKKGGEEVRRYLGCSTGNSAARIAHYFGTTGPAEGIEAGCASSSWAVGNAMRHLRSRRTNLALVGGANLLLKPYEYEDFQGILSPSGQCKVFQGDADGFARADGGIIYVLKRVSDAIDNDDRILGVIRGFGSSQEGMTRSVGTPTVGGEAAAMMAALEDAGVNPEELDWIEMHGTGTRIGDPMEVTATRLAYKISMGERDNPLIVTSIKANIGHTESVSGAAGLLKVLLAMKYGSIPPQLLTADLNSGIDFDGLVIPRVALGWKGSLAGVSSFGITGTNTHLIVERFCPLKTSKTNYEHGKLYILPLSAKSAAALADLKKKHANALELLEEQDGDDLLAAYCYTASTCRHHFDEYRSIATGFSRHDLLDALRSENCESGARNPGANMEKGTKSTNSTPVSFLFPGQGCQYVGMGLELYKSCLPYRRHFDEVNSHFIQIAGINLLEWIRDEQDIPLCSMLCVFAVEYSLLNMWMNWGVRPNLCVIGHSFGEVAAATAVGALDLVTAVRLILSLRQNVFERVEPGRMVVIMADESATRKMIHEYLETYIVDGKPEDCWIDISALNSFKQTVVSGPTETIENFMTFVGTNYVIKSTLVNHVHHAYHSRSLEEVSAAFKTDLDKLSFSKRYSRLGYLSSVHGRKLEDSEDIDPTYWAKCFRKPVKFIDSAAAATSTLGGRLFLEVGPQPVLSSLMQDNCPDLGLTCIPSCMRNASNWRTLLEAVATLYLHRVELDWTQIWISLAGDLILHKKVPHLLPTYPFQNEGPFWFNPSIPSSSLDAGVRCRYKIAHPLLGSILPIHQCGVMTDITVFVTSTDDQLERAGSWLRDHNIGPHNIFPAAGYIEMGFAVATLLSKAKSKACGIKLSEINIKTVLSLDLRSDIQTNVIYDREKLNISIFSRHVSAHSEWVLHASLNATVAPPYADITNQEIYRDQFNGDTVPSPYTKMSDLGYKFGTRFRSLTNLKTTGPPSSRMLTAGVTPSIFDQNMEEAGSFIVHPTILDAMIQASLLAQPSGLTTLRVPVAISGFEIFSLPDDIPKHSCAMQLRVQPGQNSCTLFIKENDFKWHAHASLSNLTTVSTTIEAIENLAKGNGGTNYHKEHSLLPLFVEEWSRGKQRDVSSPNALSTKEQLSSFKAISRPAAEVQEYERIAAYIRRNVAETLNMLGLSCFSLDERVTVNEISSRLGLTHLAPPFIARLLHYASGVGLLREISAKEYVVLSHSDFNLTEKNLRHDEELLRDDWIFAEFYISKLYNFLRGSESILPYLFPPSVPSLEPLNGAVSNQRVATSNFSAERLYNTTVQCSILTKNLIDVVALFGKDRNSGLRILEVGAGTGSATRELLHHFQGSSSTYTFTDISSSFLNRAEASLPDVPGVQVDFRILDLEKDVLEQGFQKEAFDVIIAMNVLHATTDLGGVVGNLRLLLTPDGNIFVAEQLRPSAFIDIIFGHCKGYWIFNDDIRSDHCLVNGDTWKVVLQSAGYGEVSIVENKDFDVGIIVATNKQDPPPPYVLIATSYDDEFANQLNASSNGSATWCNINHQQIVIQPNDLVVYCFPSALMDGNPVESQVREQLKHFLAFCRAILSVGKVEIFLVSHGLIPVGDEEASYPIAGAIRGFSRSLANEILELDIVWIDLDDDEDTMHQVKEIMAEIRTGRKLRGRSEDPFITYRNGVRYLGKLVPLVSPFATLTLPEKEYLQLRLPKSCAIEDLKWDDSFTIEDPPHLAANQVQIRILASGLNFKDILNITKPTIEFESASSIGADICGEVIAVGSAITGLSVGMSVLAINPEPVSLPNVVQLNASHVALLPQELTHVEGATLPTAFYTAYHSLVTVAKLRRGEWVLIHTASGAVGLVAIQIAHEIGANIVCTAGSRRKRAYLTDILGLTNVTSSRNVSIFLAAVKSATGNAGFHVVLNSLTSKGWKEASMSMTRVGGRFIEMSKLNIWSHQEVDQLRPDIIYTVVDLSIPDEARTVYLVGELQSWLANGKLMPIAYSTFEPPAVIPAVEHLQRAAHIGKVVIRWTRDIFNARSTYLLTGGCGELGIELARMMLSNGAKHIVLVSRRHGGREAVVSKLRQRDGDSYYSDDELGGVVVEYGDISTSAGVNEILGKITSLRMPPLRGIFHVAGVLSDGTILNMTMDKMDLVWAGKVNGAWALHEATCRLNLEHFVLYSSASWILGSPGQANYSAANAALASIADYRHRLGLKATSIAWGQWGEAGMVSGTDRTVFGARPFSNAHGACTMEHILRNLTQIGSNVMAAKLSDDVRTSWLQHYVKTNEHEYLEDLDTTNLNNVALEPEDLEEAVVSLVGNMLRIRDPSILRKAELSDIGMDSLMRIELKNRLHTRYNVVVEIDESLTISEIVKILTKALNEDIK